MKIVQNPYLRLSAALVFAVCARAELHVTGVPNFQTVNSGVYRGGQPSEEGFRSLAAAGVTTIVDLREDDSRAKHEKKFVKSLGMKYINIPMKGMHTPERKQISHALKALNDDKGGPVFIHCKRGSDRTGVVLACYRMEHDGWTNQKALSEAREYGMSWYQFPLSRYVLAYHPHENDGVLDAIKDFPGRVADALKD